MSTNSLNHNSKTFRYGGEGETDTVFQCQCWQSAFLNDFKKENRHTQLCSAAPSNTSCCPAVHAQKGSLEPKKLGSSKPRMSQNTQGSLAPSGALQGGGRRRGHLKMLGHWGTEKGPGPLSLPLHELSFGGHVFRTIMLSSNTGQNSRTRKGTDSPETVGPNRPFLPTNCSPLVWSQRHKAEHKKGYFLLYSGSGCGRGALG